MGARQQDGYRDLKAFLKLLAAVLRGGVTDGEPAAELEIVQVGPRRQQRRCCVGWS